MFYEILASHYDDIFPSEALKISFLDQMFMDSQGGLILDLACGTGTYTLALAKLGYEVWGTDLEEQMIVQARQKASKQALNAHFAVGDMQYPEQLGLIFDGLFCIGNSLAHLTSQAVLQKALQAMHSVLKKGGAAVFQIVNFDRILAKGETPLPFIERENLRFSRIYKPLTADSLEFYSVLEVKQPDGTFAGFDNTIGLRPIVSDELHDLLQAAGFTGIQMYGDFRHSMYNKLQSAATVVTARA